MNPDLGPFEFHPFTLRTVSRTLELSLQSAFQLSHTVLVCCRSRRYIVRQPPVGFTTDLKLHSQAARLLGDPYKYGKTVSPRTGPPATGLSPSPGSRVPADFGAGITVPRRRATASRTLHSLGPAGVEGSALGSSPFARRY